MKTAVAAALLLALSSPALAASVPPACIDYDKAIELIEDGGGKVIAEGYPPPFAEGQVLYFVFEGDVFMSGVNVEHHCVWTPSTLVGKYVELTPA